MEFVRDIEELTEPYSFHMGRCAPPSEGSPMQPVIEAIRHHAHIRVDDPDPVARGKLLEFLCERVATDPNELDPDEQKMRSLLEEFLGIAEKLPEALATVEGDEARRSLLFDTVATLYHRLAQRTPIVFIIKDFELATAATEALVSHLVARVGEAPILMLLILESGPRQPVDVSFFRDPSAVTQVVLEQSRAQA